MAAGAVALPGAARTPLADQACRSGKSGSLATCPARIAAEEESDLSRAASGDSDVELGQRCWVGHLAVRTGTPLSHGVTGYQPGSAGVERGAAGEELFASTRSQTGWQPALAALPPR